MPSGLPIWFAQWDARLWKAIAVSLAVHLMLLLPGADLHRPALKAQLFAQLKPPAAVGQVAQPQPVAPLNEPKKPAPARKTSDAKPSGAPEVDQPPPANQANSALENAVGEIDGESLRAYAISVAVGVSRLYGAAAPVAQQAGRVTLRASVGPAGRGVDVSISSGQAALDEEARTLVSRALAATPLPERLRGHAISFEVPVFFGQK